MIYLSRRALGDRYLNLLAQNPKRERIGRIGRNQVLEGEYRIRVAGKFLV